MNETLRLKKPDFSKKHYETIADALAHEMRYISGVFGNSQQQRQHDMCETVREVADKLADRFAEDDPLFNRERFLNACGVGVVNDG